MGCISTLRKTARIVLIVVAAYAILGLAGLLPMYDLLKAWIVGALAILAVLA